MENLHYDNFKNLFKNYKILNVNNIIIRETIKNYIELKH